MKLHRLSVPYRALSRGSSVGFTLFFVGVSLVGTEFAPAGLTREVVIAVAFAGVAAVAAWQVAYYRRFEYELTDDGLEIASGVVSRRNREIPLGRIQNVDISRNLFQRALGIAALDLETAGGGETEASLRYVGYDEAKRLQREIQQRKRGERVPPEFSESETTGLDAGTGSNADSESRSSIDAESGSNTGSGTGSSIGDETGSSVEERSGIGRRSNVEESTSAERSGSVEGRSNVEDGIQDETGARAEEREDLLFELTTGELVLLSVLSLDFRYLSILAFGPAAFPFVPGFAELAFVGGMVLLATLAVGVWTISGVVTFGRYYGFRLSRVGDELRYERGLLQRYDGSIPLTKVQTLTLDENVLMRQFGYARLAVETAGYGPRQAPSGGSEAAIPLATRDRVVRLANEVETFDAPEFSRPPKRARTRYAIRYALVLAGLAGVLLAVRSVFGYPSAWYLALAPLAFVVFVPVAAHLKWANRGYAAGQNHVFTRNGFWTRTTKVVPYYRVQTVIQVQTVFQRRRRLANVVIDTASSAGGVAVAADLDAADAAELREQVSAKLQESLVRRSTKSSNDGPEE